MTDVEPASALRRARLGAGAVALLAFTALPWACGLGVDNRIEGWVDREGPAARDYARFQEAFGSDEFVLVAYAGADWLRADHLEVQASVLEALETLPHVRRVAGPPVVRRDLLVDDDPSVLRAELLGSPFYRGFLVSEDGTAAGLLVETRLPKTVSARSDLVRAVDTAVSPLRKAGFRVHLVGPPVLNAALDEISLREGARAFPAAFALSALLVLGVLRSVRATVVAGTCAGLTLLLTLGLVGVTGHSLNLVTAVLPSLLWVLALAGVLHLVVREGAWRQASDDRRAATVSALSDVLGPSVLAAVTTALGFGSLLAADLAPVRELGGFAAAGLVFSLLVNMTVGPTLLSLLPGKPARVRATGALASMGRFATSHRRGLLVATALILALAGVLLPRLRLESDPLGFLPRDGATRRAYTFVGQRLTGYYSLEVLVDGVGHWLDPAVWPALDRVAGALERDRGVARVLSPLDFLRHLNAVSHGRDERHYALPYDRATARRLLDGFDLFGEGERTRLVADGGGTVRLSALVRVMPSRDFDRIVGVAETALRELPAPLHGTVTGVVRRLVDAQQGLVETQLRSFALAFVTVFVCVGVGLRSIRLLVVSIVPNLLPVAAAFCAMVLAGVSLDAATVMVASVAVGIAVDDTVHLLAAWRRKRSEQPGAEATASALAEVGPAMATTTAAGCVGFLSLGLSSFAPIRWLGLLGALALFVALIADALVLPAILATRFGEGCR